MADRRAASCFKTISCSHWLPEKKNKKIKSLLLLLSLLALANQDERGRSCSPGARSPVRSPLVIIFFSFEKGNCEYNDINNNKEQSTHANFGLSVRDAVERAHFLLSILGNE